jgi:hypothetical protein
MFYVWIGCIESRRFVIANEVKQSIEPDNKEIASSLLLALTSVSDFLDTLWTRPFSQQKIKKMKQKAISLLLFAMLILSTYFVKGQIPKTPKFGKDLNEHLALVSCPMDSGASAVVLFDKGESKIKYSNEKGWFYVEIRRHVRVKILNKDGLEQANITIPLYKSKSAKENLQRFKAKTYNLVSGKIEEAELSSKSRFNEEINDRVSLAKFALPQVVAGSVIEYEYQVNSEFIYNLEHWEFQREIPTMLSIYTVDIPEYFKYNLKLSGYEKIDRIEDNGRESVLITETSMPGFMGATQKSTYKINYQTAISTFYGQNIPKLGFEPFIDNIRNYTSRLDFELQYTQFPYQGIKSYATDWNAVTEEMLVSKYFGKELESARFLKEDIQSLKNISEEPSATMMAVYDFIKGKIKWNQRYRVEIDKGMKKAYTEGSGNSAEVNLCLIAALREAGFDAFPIALSTRSNGVIQEWEVSMSKFNHVIAGLMLNDKLVTLDATSSFSAPNILPLECLNGSGRIIDKNRMKWVDLYPTTLSKSVIMAKMSLTATGEISGTIDKNHYDYSALKLYNTIAGDENLEKYKEKLEKEYNNGSVDSIKVSQSLSPSPVIKVSYHASIPGSVLHSGDFIYLSPGLGELTTRSPLVSEIRKLPINFHYPFVETLVLSYKIPEGFAVQEVPANIMVRLQNGKGLYQYSVSVVGTDLIINSKTSINQTLFLPTEYEDLVLFFEKLVAKNNEKIVLKKL